MFRRLALVLSLFLGGCSTGRVGVRGNGSMACGVTHDAGLAKRTVSVDGGVATFYGLFGRRVARMDPGGIIYLTGLWDTEAGACRGGRLVIKGLFSDKQSEPIDRSTVMVPGIFSPTRYDYTPTCSRCEAALGAYALIALDEEDDPQLQQQSQRH
jgi:hypothetical protein